LKVNNILEITQYITMEWRRTLVLLSISFFLTTASGPVFAYSLYDGEEIDAPANPFLPEVYIVMDTDEIDADVQRSSSQVVAGSIISNIPATAPPGYTIKVMLFYSTTLNAIDVELGEFNLNKDIPDARFSLFYPLEEKMSPDNPITFTFDGYWRVIDTEMNNQLTPVHCILRPIPYCFLDFSPIPEVDIDNDVWNDIPVFVENQGNAPATVTLMASGDDNCEAGVRDGTKIVGSGEAVQFIVQVKSTNSETDGTVRLSVSGTVEGDIYQTTSEIIWHTEKGFIGTMSYEVFFVLIGILIITIAVVITVISILRSKGKKGSILDDQQ
jgi:hypothetical protein